MRQSSRTIQKVKDYYYEGGLPLYMRGKYFSLKEIRIIHQCIEMYYDVGRTKISQAICEKLDWRQPNGWLKDRACRDVMLRLNDLGLIELPPSKSHKRKSSKQQGIIRDYLQQFDLETPIITLPTKIEFDFAKSNYQETLWNQLVDKYHYLGHSVSVGRTIKYIIRSNGQLIGAISFSSASWHLSTRDEILKKLGYSTEVYRDIVINNTRFLILPHVSVKNLASKLLAIATTQVVKDWTWYYSIKPQIVETFVEPSRFDGTCYRAANWIEIGKTKGYAKRGSSFHNSQEPKLIFIYGLNKKIRRLLNTVLPLSSDLEVK